MTDLLHLISKGSAPPDRFRYTFPEDGHRIYGYHYQGWLGDIKEHYQRNEYPMPANWRELAEDQLCRLLPPGCCSYENGEPPEYFVNSRFTLEDALRGTMALASWTASGFQLVEKAVAEERGATCAACYANVSIPGCGACVNFAGKVADIVGTTELKSEAQLFGRVCAFCHCATKAHVWLPAEVLKSGVSQEALEAMPKNYCWKAREILALQSPLP